MQEEQDYEIAKYLQDQEVNIKQNSKNTFDVTFYLSQKEKTSKNKHQLLYDDSGYILQNSDITRQVSHFYMLI
jgi:hypothetical protein